MTTFASTDTDLFAAAEAAKHRAFAQLDASDYAEETTAILRVILETGDRMATFSANDCRPYLPSGCSSPRIGRCFALAAERGWIEWVGMVRSTDVGTHGKRVNTYRLAVA